ncbi:MAG: winged helix-turn-helix domain-containing protein [SAR202 cluster bacterium]|nr:winged helix-turn-helix domain-containing protein [SAR202 cluster bacterium]
MIRKLITTQGLVLSCILHDSTSTTREMANYIGITERTTLKIISDLEIEGYVKRSRIGRRNVYSVDPKLPLRHLAEEVISILTKEIAGDPVSL